MRPVLVIHEHSDGDLLVVPVTTRDPRGVGDTPIALWQEAGLRLESTARMRKFATIVEVQTPSVPVAAHLHHREDA